MLLGGLIAGMTSYDNGDRGWSLFGHIMLGGLFGGAVGIAAGFVIGVLGPTIGGMGAIVLGDTMAMSGAFAAVGVAVEVLTAAGAGALVAAGAGALGNVMFSKNIIDENGVRVRHSTQYIVYDNTINYHISQKSTIFNPLLPNRAHIRARFFVREKSVGQISTIHIVE